MHRSLVQPGKCQLEPVVVSTTAAAGGKMLRRASRCGSEAPVSVAILQSQLQGKVFRGNPMRVERTTPMNPGRAAATAHQAARVQLWQPVTGTLSSSMLFRCFAVWARLTFPVTVPIVRPDLKIGGRLHDRQFRNEWRKFRDPQVDWWLRHGFQGRFLDEVPPQIFLPRYPPPTPEVSSFLIDEFTKWETMGAAHWVKVPSTGKPLRLNMLKGPFRVSELPLPHKFAFILHSFAVFQNGKYRAIINGKPVNLYLEHIPFRQKYLKDFKEMVEQDDWFTRIDVRKMYLHGRLGDKLRSKSYALVYERNQRWARILALDSVFFGTQEAPYQMTYLMRTCNAAFMLATRARITGQMDDYCLMCRTFRDSLFRSQEYLWFLTALGWVIHQPVPNEWEKTVVIPRQLVTALGATINSQTMFWYVKYESLQKTRKNARSLLNQAQSNGEIALKAVESVQGSAQWMSHFSTATPAHLGETRVFIRRALRSDPARRCKKFPAPRPLVRELARLVKNLHSLSGRSIAPTKVHFWLTKDASDVAMAGVALNLNKKTQVFSAFFTEIQEFVWHINRKELQATISAVKAVVLKYDLSNIVLGVLDDNSAAVANVNRQGGRSVSLARPAARFIRWLFRRGILLIAFHLPGEFNGLSDRPSRTLGTSAYDWKLCRRLFHRLERIFCPAGFDVDGFAAFNNTQCTRYAAFSLDPMAELCCEHRYTAGACPVQGCSQEACSQRIDFFAQELHLWRGNMFLFPPPNLVGRMLQHLIHYRRNAVVVVPVWKRQPWFARILERTDALPLILDGRDGHFRLPHKCVEGAEHPSPPWLTIALRFCADPGKCAKFRRTFSMSCSRNGRNMAIRDMIDSGHFSWRSRKTETLAGQIITTFLS